MSAYNIKNSKEILVTLRNKLIALVALILFSLLGLRNQAFAANEESTSFIDLFEGKGGYLHPFISLSLISSDNIAGTHEDTSSDTILMTSPGIWFAFPGSRQQLLQLNTSSYSPGGLATSRDPTNYFKRYQTYLLYSSDIEKYSKYTDKEVQKRKLEGIFQYNLKGGVRFELLGQFNQLEDPKELTESTENDTYQSFYSGFLVSYDISEMFRLRFDYNNFQVTYDHDRNSPKNRMDGSYSIYLYSGITEKSDIFLQYQNIGIQYNEGIISNSTQTQTFGGITWKATEKSQGSFKIGQAQKRFDSQTTGAANNMIMELSLGHSFTPKTSINITAGRNTKEPLAADENYILSQNASIGYSQQINNKFGLKVSLYSSEDDYIRNQDSIKKNKTLNSKVGIGYTFNDWLLGDISYSNSKTDSTLEALNTVTNIMSIRLMAYF